ncbi:MAG: large subunit ribosomal protein L3 [Parcubacteria group bacterium Gr01-1014_31]|nr:MAG: large subunit ribosomal protein L3 [Parcubacteria group bacterium Gr01-1014_31]
MKFILGRKSEMTQRYRPDGSAVVVTKVVAEPCVVAQIKSVSRDGYTAVQVASGKRKRVAKPQAGHLKGIGPVAVLREIRLTPEEAKPLAVGDRITVETFVPGDVVKVTGWSKGRGFQGVVKRHGFKGSPKTHGHKDQLRMPGSSGAGGVQRVRPGKRMPGRMGNEQITVANLEIIAVDVPEHTLYVQGAIPGSRNGLLVIQGKGDLTTAKAAAPVEPAAVPAISEAPAVPAATTTQ